MCSSGCSGPWDEQQWLLGTWRLWSPCSMPMTMLPAVVPVHSIIPLCYAYLLFTCYGHSSAPQLQGGRAKSSSSSPATAGPMRQGRRPFPHCQLQADRWLHVPSCGAIGKRSGGLVPPPSTALKSRAQVVWEQLKRPVWEMCYAKPLWHG